MELAHTVHWVISRDERRRLVRLTRTSTPFTSLEDLERSMALVQAAMARVDRGRHGLLVDIREAPLRTDPSFEARFARHRTAMLAGYARVAVLVRSAVGKLQVARHARQDGMTVYVAEDEAAAIAYAAGG